MTDRHSGDLPAHPSAEDLAAYLSGGLSETDRHGLEAHLSACLGCRREVTTASRLLRTRPGGRPWRVVLPIAAAAVLALVLLVPRSRTSPETVRAPNDGREGAPSIVATSPADGDTVAAAIVFAWHPQLGELLYRLTLTDRTGRGIWTTDTSDTTLVLPPGVRLDRGGRFFWYVDALDGEGRSLTTGTQSFWTSP